MNRLGSEEKMRNALAQMGIPVGADITIMKKKENLTEIFVDGEYFNTYDAEKDSFLLFAPKSEDVKPFCINLTVANPTLWDENHAYNGAKIRLPATDSEISDAFAIARISEDNTKCCKIINCGLYGTDYTEGFIQGATVREMNYLASRLSALTELEQLAFCGYTVQRGIENLSIKDLINITYNLKSCLVIPDVQNDEQLGEFYADNGFIAELKELPEKVLEYLDMEKIGRDRRETEHGIFTENGYFMNASDEFKELYDGVTPLDNLGSEDYIFKLRIENADKKTVICLPADEEYLQAQKSLLGVESFNECELWEVQSLIPNLHGAICTAGQIEDMNTLAHAVKKLEEKGQLHKFKAVMNYTACQDMDEALGYIEKLSEYDLCTDIICAADYGKYIINQKNNAATESELDKYFDFERFGFDRISEDDVVITPYGAVREKSVQPVMDKKAGSMTEVAN
ncbi:MAG: Antirestriction protein (ArdA) [Firmicutes bacterium ADurb.Bin193]|nr:MAG: Antirestriction protein (ArdA) [Firmicutes bacterium ADurb.Bin193]